jgi:hypothetical protein
MVPPLHDNLLVSYAVDCEARTIRLRARRPHWPNRHDQDRFVLFTGVEGYHFQNDAFGNIVFSLEQVPVDRVLSQFSPEIRESYRQAGAPGPWAADLDTAGAALSAKRIQAFVLSSSYGLSGWVLAKDVSIERDSPIRSEIVLCVLPLIHNWRGGLDVSALVGEVISADARLNTWFAHLKRKEGSNLSVERWLEILAVFEPIEPQCKTAVGKFVQGGDQTDLIESLSEVVAKHNQRPNLP